MVPQTRLETKPTPTTAHGAINSLPAFGRASGHVGGPSGTARAEPVPRHGRTKPTGIMPPASFPLGWGASRRRFRLPGHGRSRHIPVPPLLPGETIDSLSGWGVPVASNIFSEHVRPAARDRSLRRQLVALHDPLR